MYMYIQETTHCVHPPGPNDAGVGHLHGDDDGLVRSDTPQTRGADGGKAVGDLGRNTAPSPLPPSTSAPPSLSDPPRLPFCRKVAGDRDQIRAEEVLSPSLGSVKMRKGTACV